MPLFTPAQLINAVAVTTTVGDALAWLNMSKYLGSVLGAGTDQIIAKLQRSAYNIIIQGVNVLCVG